MKDIPGFNNYTKIDLIDIGLSKDKKYYIETVDHQRLLLRISDISEYDRKKAAYERMKHMDKHGIPMSRPVNFGVCDDGKSVYQLLTWCSGEVLDDVFTALSEVEQYRVGIKAGETLRQIHSVPIAKADITTAAWNERYSSFIDESISDFHKTGIEVENAKLILDYFNNNRYLLKERPQCYMHGDFHTGNLMVAEQELSVIDWEIHLFNSYGDPWHEVNMKETPHFSTGFIHGYFNGEPPEDYWRVLALYSSIGAISTITWAYYHQPKFLEGCIENVAKMLISYDNMQSYVPKEYFKDFKLR
ncbi:MAG: phosphotransferase [Defluviitaleaceae bacterium]|nr:phosphotransferase [Defluviitaleaceae bacterium]